MHELSIADDEFYWRPLPTNLIQRILEANLGAPVLGYHVVHGLKIIHCCDIYEDFHEGHAREASSGDKSRLADIVLRRAPKNAAYARFSTIDGDVRTEPITIEYYGLPAEEPKESLPQVANA